MFDLEKAQIHPISWFRDYIWVVMVGPLIKVGFDFHSHFPPRNSAMQCNRAEVRICGLQGRNNQRGKGGEGNMESQSNVSDQEDEGASIYYPSRAFLAADLMDGPPLKWTIRVGPKWREHPVWVDGKVAWNKRMNGHPPWIENHCLWPTSK